VSYSPQLSAVLRSQIHRIQAFGESGSAGSTFLIIKNSKLKKCNTCNQYLFLASLKDFLASKEAFFCSPENKTYRLFKKMKNFLFFPSVFVGPIEIRI
jgi:hypothetical protein